MSCKLLKCSSIVSVAQFVPLLLLLLLVSFPVSFPGFSDRELVVTGLPSERARSGAGQCAGSIILDNPGECDGNIILVNPGRYCSISVISIGSLFDSHGFHAAMLRSDPSQTSS